MKLIKKNVLTLISVLFCVVQLNYSNPKKTANEKAYYVIKNDVTNSFYDNYQENWKNLGDFNKNNALFFKNTLNTSKKKFHFKRQENVYNAAQLVHSLNESSEVQHDKNHNHNYDHSNISKYLFTTNSNSLGTYSTTESLPAGSLIIAMNKSLQDNSDNKVRKVYGLAVHLLHAGIPLKWIIKPDKASRTATDFSAKAKIEYPSPSGSYSNRNFKSGALAIYPGYESQANSVINSFSNDSNSDIIIYKLQNATSVPVYANLTHKPKVAVFSDNSGIHTSIMSSAGMESGTHYNVINNANSINSNSCYTMASAPHKSTATDNERGNVRTFVQNGGNFFAQCAAVRAFQNNTNKLFSNSSLSEQVTGNLLYDNPHEPMAQFEGTISPNSGSLKYFGLQPEPQSGLRIVHDVNNRYKAYVGPIDGFSASSGGYVHYLASHTYNGDIDADRMYLNAVLRPADRPSNCNLNLAHNAINDTGSVDECGDSIIINVIANDSNPLNENLTVNVIGAGSHGTFINNGNGTVTYTLTDSFFSGTDSVDYQLCDANNTCSTATISINGPSNIKIEGNVFLDDDEDGSLDTGEGGQNGVSVKLYRDNNQNGVYDNGDDFIETTTTNTNGEYNFSVNLAATGGSTTITSSKATLIYEGDKSKNYGNDNYIEVSNYTGYNTYSLIEFNIGQLPQGCSIQSANLKVYHKNGSEGGSNFNFNAKKILSSWNEGTVTWNNFNSNNIGTTIYDTETGGKNDIDGKEYSFNIKNLVTDWVNNNNNNGVALVPDSSNGSSYFAIHSDDSSSSSFKPKLEIVTSCNNNNYVAVIDQTTLPQGSSLTTTSQKAFSFSSNGQISCGNNFGLTTCNNITSAGTISGDESNCSDFDPNEITSSSLASGGNGGTIEYKWQKKRK